MRPRHAQTLRRRAITASFASAHGRRPGPCQLLGEAAEPRRQQQNLLDLVEPHRALVRLPGLEHLIDQALELEAEATELLAQPLEAAELVAEHRGPLVGERGARLLHLSPKALDGPVARAL